MGSQISLQTRFASWRCGPAELDAARTSLFEVLTTVTFAELGAKTKQILRTRVIKSTAEAPRYLAGMEAGWTQSLERLAAYLAAHSKE
jgi:uncharacterized protein YndB with AHSA1/START domain